MFCQWYVPVWKWSANFHKWWIHQYNYFYTIRRISEWETKNTFEQKFKTSFLRLQGWICPKSKHFVGPENTKLKIGLFKTSKEPWFWRKVCECYVFNRIVSWSISLFTTFFQIYIFSATFSALVIPGTEIWIVTLSTLLECHETNNLWR